MNLKSKSGDCITSQTFFDGAELENRQMDDPITRRTFHTRGIRMTHHEPYIQTAHYVPYVKTEIYLIFM